MELNYKEFGQGEPVIILHGLFGMLDNWQSIAKQLAEEYWVFSVDQRNHGRSPHVPEISYPLMAEDLKEFMDQRWIPRANIIGHSMGGKTAMQFALNYPDMVERLIVVDITPGENINNHSQIFEALFSLDLTTISNRKEADNVLNKIIKDFGVRQFLMKNLSRNKEGVYQWKMNLDAIYKNYHEILAAIKHDHPFDGESLFIKGALSNYISSDKENEIFSLFEDATIKSINDAGHWVHADAPEELLIHLRSFLNS